MISVKLRFLISMIYFVTMGLSYLLMLIAMTFNGGLFIAVVLGLGVGYFIFGFTRKNPNTPIYNPEGDKCCTELD